MNTSATVSTLLNGQKIVPVVVIENKQQALGLSEALLDGGISVIEITLRNEYGLHAVEEVKKEFPNMLVLAGTVNSADSMISVVSAGADGIISPGITQSLADTAKSLNVAYLPGVGTASEVLMAIENSLSECKLFPATVVGGVSTLKAFGGPFPEMHFCPTGGVNKKNYTDFLALKNVMCVGGSWVAPSNQIKAHNWSAITQLCKEAIKSL